MKTALRALVLGAAVALLLGGPALAQSTTATSQPSNRKAQDAEVDFVDSEQAVWNTRSVNDSIFMPGASVNSVMYERKAVRAVYRTDFFPQTKVEDVQIDKPMSNPPVLKIQGKSVDLGQ